MNIASHDFIDDIYEAGVISDTWPDVLYRLSKSYNGVGGVLFAFGANGTQNWVASPDILPHVNEFIQSGMGPLNQRPIRLAALNYEGFATDLDAFTLEEIELDDVYREFFGPRGMGWTAATMVRAPSGDTLAFSIDRAFRKGPFEDYELLALDELRPHLARAALLSSRLDLKRAQAMTEALGSIGLPAAVLREGGKLYATNALLDKLIPGALQDTRARIALANKAADAALAVSIARLAVKDAAHQSCSIPVTAQQEVPPLIVHLLPVKGAANDIFARSTAVLLVTPVDKGLVPTAEVLQGLFDLTPAEARVARAIAETKSIDDIANANGLSRETIRTQLAAVLGKTGLRRQQDLVALVAGKGLPPAGNG